MLKLLVASLFALTCSTTTVAIADAVAPRQPPPPPAGCVVGTLRGPILFEIDHLSDIKAGSTGVIQVAVDGSWRVVHSRDGKVVDQASGCMPDAELRSLAAVLASATWTTQTQQIRCMAYSASYTQYRYNGVLKLTRRTCDGFIVDDKTSKALVAAEAIVKRLGTP